MEGDQNLENKDKKKHDISEKLNSSDSKKPAVEDTCVGEMPQCKMGNKKVDNMSFMIACTNWVACKNKDKLKDHWGVKI
ncbi:hypothetical protein WMY93_011315 [Mugilogobius chulae]|uniref:Uncharacterized protein n=1 Tax=Mugilogobius chulae TaxID=88201 RepID=A0AAW0PC88_9GOBI